MHVFSSRVSLLNASYPPYPSLWVHNGHHRNCNVIVVPMAEHLGGISRELESGVKMLSSKLIKVSIGTFSRFLSSCKIAWMACWTFADGTPSYSSVVLSGISRSSWIMFSNLYLGFKSPRPLAILEYSEVGLLRPTADWGLLESFFWANFLAGWKMTQSFWVNVLFGRRSSWWWR